MVIDKNKTMRKEEVELIILNVSADGEDAISMKFYKNGTTCRFGVGGLPQIGVSGMSCFENTDLFNQLIEKVPETVLERPVSYEEETPNGYLEYVMAFYGMSDMAYMGKALIGQNRQVSE